MGNSAKKVEPGQGVSVLTQLMLPLAVLVRRDLREFVVTLGMQAVEAMLEKERIALCGERYRHDPDREATRGGHTPSKLRMGGRSVSVRRPRVVGAEGSIPLPSWTALSAADPMSERVLEQMTLGVATRKYARSLEPLPAGLEERSTSKSEVSRVFVETTAAKLQEWMSRPIGELDLCAVFIDGLHFAEHVVLVALGVDATGTKHVLALWEGATENGVACRDLLADLKRRGLRDTRPLLFVIDGSGALRSAIRDTFGKRGIVQRCQVHKIRNVLSYLPEKMHCSVRTTLRQAYKSEKVDIARRQLNALERSLQKEYPSAANSLSEGMEETLTIMKLGLPRTLERSFSTTNPIECLNDRIRSVTRRVKRWRGGEMILRWTAAGVWEAARGFRRLKGYRHMPKLLAALQSQSPPQLRKAVDAVGQAA